MITIFLQQRKNEIFKETCLNAKMKEEKQFA